MNEQQMLAWVENASPIELLRKQRFEPIGSPWFANSNVALAIGERLAEIQRKDPAEWTRLSKGLGWGT